MVHIRNHVTAHSALCTFRTCSARNSYVADASVVSSASGVVEHQTTCSRAPANLQCDDFAPSMQVLRQGRRRDLGELLTGLRHDFPPTALFTASGHTPASAATTPMCQHSGRQVPPPKVVDEVQLGHNPLQLVKLRHHHDVARCMYLSFEQPHRFLHSRARVKAMWLALVQARVSYRLSGAKKHNVVLFRSPPRPPPPRPPPPR
jgi:hypothetical protein